MLEILAALISFMVARFGRLGQKFDELQCINVHIFWFYLHNHKSHSCFSQKNYPGQVGIRKNEWRKEYDKYTI